MAANHFIVPTMPIGKVTAARLGAGNTANDRFTDADAGKFVKLAATDRYDLTAAGDVIEGVVVNVESATSNGYTVGGVVSEGKVFVTADGLQATPGTGTIAAGDYVVTGTVVARNTAMSGFPKVCKATVQPGATPADLAAAGAQIKASLFAWRVVSLGQAGTGAVGTVIVIERVAP